MSDAPKVVGINGQPINITTTTTPKIMEFIDAARAIAGGEKHTGIGMFLVDDKGRVWTNFLVESGAAWLDSVGAASLLEHRIRVAYEKGMEQEQR